MTEEDKPKRPNENYRLSKSDDAEPDPHEQLVFYYSREKRLEKAPQAVRDLYEKKKGYQGFNPIKPLVADKPRAILFFTILMICAAIYILSIVDKLGTSSYTMDGNRLEITGARYEGTTIIVLKKTAVNRRNSAPYTGAVDLAVFPLAADTEGRYPNFMHRIFFSLEPVEEYRFAVPFDFPEQLIVLQTERTTLNIKFNPD